MIIKNKAVAFPINNLLLVLILSVPFCVYLGVCISSIYDSYICTIKYGENFHVENGTVIMTIFFMLLLICFITCGAHELYKYFKNLKQNENISSIDINVDNIKFIYPNNIITVDKQEIKKIDINFHMMSMMVTYNKGCMLPRKLDGTVEYIDISIHTNDNQTYSIKKDFFILFPSKNTIDFFINLQNILKHYTGLYNLEQNETTVGLKLEEFENKKLEEHFLSSYINYLKEANKQFKLIAIFIIISSILLDALIRIYWNPFSIR